MNEIVLLYYFNIFNGSEDLNFLSFCYGFLLDLGLFSLSWLIIFLLLNFYGMGNEKEISIVYVKFVISWWFRFFEGLVFKVFILFYFCWVYIEFFFVNFILKD